MNTNFSTDGLQTVDFGFVNEYSTDITVQSDGKIVLVGYKSPSDDISDNIYVCRLNTDGSLDNTFDSDGKLAINLSDEDIPIGVEIASDGKIIIGFETINGGNTDFGVLKLNDDGSLDNSFGTNGITEVTIASAQRPEYMHVDANDNIYLVGYENNTNNPLYGFFVMKFTSSGSLDNSFSSDGYFEYSFGAQNDYAITVDTQSDGKLIVGGNYDVGGVRDISVIRLNTNGTLDATFATAGEFIYTALPNVGIGGLKVLSDDRILVGSYSNNDFLAIMLDEDGSLDNSFKSDGYETYDLGGTDYCFNVIEDEDGRILLTGDSDVNGDRDFAIIKINNVGELDLNFGSNGIKLVDFGGIDISNGIDFNTAGDIFIGGYTDVNADIDFAIASLKWQDPPYIPTSSLAVLTSNSIKINFNIEYDGGSIISNRGLVYSLSSTPTLSNNVIQSGSGDGSYQITIEDLSPGTTYYIRSFAINSIGTTYGTEQIITTPDATDNDSDGIENSIELNAPYSGDGNNDGIQDSQQANVGSFISIAGSYITVQLISCDSLLKLENYIRTENGNFEFPFGVISFTAPCSEAQVKIYYHNVNDLSLFTYRKEIVDGRWIDYEDSEFSIETIDGNQVAVATLTLSDGGIGDSDGIVNGMIVDPGGPAIPITSNIPIWSWWYALLLIPSIIVTYRKLS